MSWRPGIYDLHVVRGDNFEQFFSIVNKGTQAPIVTTGWSGASQVRGPSEVLVVQFDLFMGDAGFIISLTRTQTDLVYTASTTGALSWDVELIDLNLFKRTWLKGKVTAEGDVTFA